AQNLERYPKWIEQVEAKGHRVCNHSYTHPNLASRGISDAGLRREIEKGAGYGRCRLFRPPMMAHDERSDRVAKELGLSVFLWDIDTRDWEEIPADEIYNRVLRAVEPGSVVLFHLQARRTLRALKGLLPRLVREGYVLSWDPRDVDQAARARFGVGRGATWLSAPAAARERWLANFAPAVVGEQPIEVSGRPAPWPFPVGEAEP
ncbi:MAG: polysaccharide deacetylase family protein, partial [Polyangiaceae bacterium]